MYSGGMGSDNQSTGSEEFHGKQDFKEGLPSLLELYLYLYFFYICLKVWLHFDISIANNLTQVIVPIISNSLCADKMDRGVYIS